MIYFYNLNKLINEALKYLISYAFKYNIIVKNIFFKFNKLKKTYIDYNCSMFLFKLFSLIIYLAH